MNVLSNAVLVAASVSRSPRASPHESLTTEAPLVTAVVSRREEVRVQAALRPDEEDVRSGRHGVRGLHVERLLGVPAAGGALGLVVDLRRNDVGELGRLQRVGRVVQPEVLLRVAAAGSASRRRRRSRSSRPCRCCPWPPTWSARRRRAAGPACSRRCHRAADGCRACTAARVLGVGLLSPVGRARLGLRNPAGGGGSWPGCAARAAGIRPAGARALAATYWLTPTAPETTPASDDGMVSVPWASRTRCPFTL